MPSETTSDCAVAGAFAQSTNWFHKTEKSVEVCGS